MGLLQWETIDTINTRPGIMQQYIYITRARVPGGWLVMAYASANTAGLKTSEQDVSVTFVPDPTYSWAIAPAP